MPGASRAELRMQAEPGIEPGPPWQGLRGKSPVGRFNITGFWQSSRSQGVSEFLCKRFGLQLTEMRSPN